MKAGMAKYAPGGPAPDRSIEIVVAEGLEGLTRTELRQRGLGHGVQPIPGGLRLASSGDLRALLGLRTATSVYLVQPFAVPRPRALLGDQQLRTVVAAAETALRLHPAGAFRTLYLSAAGADSSVLRRFKEELSGHLGLTTGVDDGDLLLRLRRSSAGNGWELLVRLSPRPLATRPWRVCNREGALNGPVAHAMALLSAPGPGDRYLNLGCGSGTLLIERLLLGPARHALGCDISTEALDCARANLAAAGLHNQCALHTWNACHLPLPDASLDVISADLPFGHLVGSHGENVSLYPALLAEAARVAQPGARCVLLSHEVRLMERLLADSPLWATTSVTRVDLGGLYPRIFVLRRLAQP